MRRSHLNAMFAALSILLGSGTAFAQSASQQDTGRPSERIAFGSCNRTWRENLLWKPITDLKPDLWIWLGDIVYARDYDIPDLRKNYERLNRNPQYQNLRQICPIVATWDDHDYAGGEAGGAYTLRKESQKLLLDFLGEPPDSPRRQQEGIYWSYTYGPKGKRVRVVLIDTRYFRPEAGRRADLLGPEQWRWLQRQLTEDPVEVLLLGSSIQLIPSEHPYDKWADFPASRERLFNLLDRSTAKRLVILSGDRHMAEISRENRPATGRFLYEITSSGMTHTCYSSLKNLYFDFSREPNRARIAGPFIGLNFGVVRIDWSKATPDITLETIDPSGEPKLSARVQEN